MNVIRYLLITTALLLPIASYAETSKFEVGIIVGDPSGLHFKKWINPSQAIDIAASWSTSGNDELYIHANYLTHDYTMFKVEKGILASYYGVGAYILDEDTKDTISGIRIPIGLDYFVANRPLTLFIEIAPKLDLSPDTDFEFDAAVGIRYRFLSK